MKEWTTLEWILIALVLLVGSFCQGATGFGFGLIAMGLLSMVMSVTDSLLLNTALTSFLTLIILHKYWRYIDVKPLLYSLLPAALVGRVSAYFFLHAYGGTDWIRKVLGLFLIGMVLFLIWQKRRETITGTKLDWSSPVLGAVAGLAAGWIGGVFGVGGPFLVMYFLARFDDKERYTANLQAVFLLLSVITLTAHGLGGDFTGTLALYIALGLPLIGIGTYAGMRLFDRLPMQRLHYVIYSIILFAGVNALIL